MAIGGHVLETAVGPLGTSFQRRRDHMRFLVADLERRGERIKQGGDEQYHQRHDERGKLLPRDRIDRLLDSGTPFLELSQLVPLDGYDEGMSADVEVDAKPFTTNSGPFSCFPLDGGGYVSCSVGAGRVASDGRL